MLVEEPIRSRLEGLALHASGFRHAVDEIFTQRFQTHEDWLRYFWTVLELASQLYADYVVLTPGLNRIEAPDDAPESPMANESGVQAEASLRERYDSVLRGMPHWKQLTLNAPFGEITRLRTADDFVQNLVLHVPEAYTESIRVERWAKEFNARPAATPLGSLIVGLEHMGRNHILFALPALQFVADETSWDV